MDPTRVNRVRFRAWRRGFREADLILGPFADAHASRMSEAELTGFERLLDEGDHDIYEWILGRTPTPSEFDNELMARLRAFRPSQPAHGG